MTPAETLRLAAKFMRSRAQAATGDYWEQDGPHDVIGWGPDPSGEFDDDKFWVVDGLLNEADTAYIASMHPGVALAVAAWLESVSQIRPATGELAHALVVARAYLGEEASA